MFSSCCDLHDVSRYPLRNIIPHQVCRRNFNRILRWKIFRYRLIDQNFKYLLKCLLLPIIYSCTIIIVSFVYLNDNKIPFCNPPLAMPSEACRAWSVSNMVINTATLISYSIVIIVFKYKRKQKTWIFVKTMIFRRQYPSRFEESNSPIVCDCNRIHFLLVHLHCWRWNGRILDWSMEGFIANTNGK